MPKRLLPALAVALTLFAAGSAGASHGTKGIGASSRAYGIRVSVAGGAGGGTQSVSAPPDAVGFAGGFSYPADGSIVSAGSITESATANTSSSASSTASVEVSSLSLFGGEVSISGISARATASAKEGISSGTLSGVASIGSGRVALGDWGYAYVGEQGSSGGGSSDQGYRGFVTALDIHVTADHGGLPAGSEILVGYAEAAAQAAAPALPPAAPAPPAPPRASGGPTAKNAPGPVIAEPKTAPEPKPGGLAGPVRRPPNLQPKLTAGGYVFPVYGPSSFVDTYGSPRADVSWHHGDDIFAPLGAPILAVARGTVFSVGWNTVGGNRLWLRDAQGNEFYYAHLSAFTPLARNGAHVQAGDVVGFVGNTGDAQGTPYHVHFEIHPVGLLGLGYDGVVDPTTYLTAWEHLRDVRFAASGGWAPPSAPASNAPKPGAILLQVTDISTASGLRPGSLRRALAPASSEGDGALVGLTGGGAATDGAAATR